MAKEDITVVYAAGDTRLRAHVSLERDDAGDKAAPSAPPAESSEVDWIELTGAHVKSAAAFTRLLDENARATDRLSLWCYRDVWVKLLALLKVRHPLPDKVQWPPEKRSRGR